MAARILTKRGLVTRIAAYVSIPTNIVCRSFLNCTTEICVAPKVNSPNNFFHQHRVDTFGLRKQSPPKCSAASLSSTTLTRHPALEGSQRVVSQSDLLISLIPVVSSVMYNNAGSNAVTGCGQWRCTLAMRKQLQSYKQSKIIFQVGGIRTHTGHSHGGGGSSELGVSIKEAGPGGEAAERMMRIGLVADILLTVGKGAAGFVSGSAAIIADAAHSLSDIMLSGVSLWSVRVARAPSNKTYPYGHGKFETLGAMGVALLLVGTGGGIAWHALGTLQELIPELGSFLGSVGGHVHGASGAHTHGVDMSNMAVALSAAVLSIGVKEGLYWSFKSVGDRYGSQILKAQSWHHRSDSFSSLVALVGVGGSMVGVPLLDPCAAMVVGAMIVRAGGQISVQSGRELVDIGVGDAILDPIRETVLDINGVQGCSFLRGRKMGSSIHADIFIQVEPFLSVSGAHAIGETVRHTLIHKYPLLTEAQIHIDASEGRCCSPPLALSEGNEGKEGEGFITSDQSARGWLPRDFEVAVEGVIRKKFNDKIELRKVTTHFLVKEVKLDLNVRMDSAQVIRDAETIVGELRRVVMEEIDGVSDVDVFLQCNSKLRKDVVVPASSR